MTTITAEQDIATITAPVVQDSASPAEATADNAPSKPDVIGDSFIDFGRAMKGHLATLLASASSASKAEKQAALDELSAFFDLIITLPSLPRDERLLVLFKAFRVIITSGADEAQTDAIRQAIAAITSGENTSYSMFPPEFRANMAKSMSAELARLEKTVTDNMAEVVAYMPAPKKGSRSANTANGDKTMWRPTLAEIQAQDWFIKTGEHTCILMHSGTVSTQFLTTHKIKASATTWVMLRFGGDMQITSETKDGKKIASIQPSSQGVKPKSVKGLEFELESLSGFERNMTIALKGLSPDSSEAKKISVNGWQACKMLAKPFVMDGLSRVKREIQ